MKRRSLDAESQDQLAKESRQGDWPPLIPTPRKQIDSTQLSTTGDAVLLGAMIGGTAVLILASIYLALGSYL
jgi:hypothetical protein